MDALVKNIVVEIDKPKLYAEVDQTKNVLLYRWKGHILDDEATDGFSELLAIIKKRGINNVIADISQFKGGTVKIAKWVNEEYSEMLKSANVQKMAIIVPESAFGEFSNTVALGQKFVSLIQVEKFSALQDAHNWFEK